MDKYWTTFSQSHKSSAAAGLEAACGVVRHFKKVQRSFLWGDGKQGHTACPKRDQPGWGHFLFSQLILQPFTSVEPSREKLNHLSILPSILLFFPQFLRGFINSPVYLSSHLWLSTVVSTDRGSLRLLSRRPFSGFLSLPMQPASAPGRQRSTRFNVSLHL